MKTHVSCRRMGGYLCLALALAAPAAAQTIRPESSPAPKSTSASDVVQLEEFDVTSTQAKGYQAANSISATGIGVPTYNVPLPIMVITSEYLSDTAALDMRDAIQNTPGVVTDPRNEAAFTLRGFSGNIVYRNGYYRRQNYQTWDMERVEVIEGPAAIFFGSVRPGGIINYVTARPDFKQTYVDVMAQVGSFNFTKGMVKYNQVVNKEVAFRITAGALNSDNNGYQYDFMNQSHLSGVVTWKTDKQQLTINADRQRRNDYLYERGYATTHEGYLGNPTIPATQTAATWVAANFGPTAPVFTMFAPIYPANDPYGRSFAYNTDNFEKFFDWDVDLNYVLKINDHVIWETAASRGQDDQPGVRANNGNQTPFANGTVNFAFQYFENNRNSEDWNNRLTIKFDVGSVKNTLQFGQQFQEVKTDQPGFLSAAGAFTTNNLSATITGFNPATSAPITGALARVFANQPINDWRHAIDITSGFYVALQSAFFHDRVHLLTGGRYALINGSVAYSTRPTNPSVVGRSTATTPQLGVIGEVIPGLSLYSTYSRSIEPQNTSVDVLGNVAGPIHSSGVDAGIKTNFLGGKLSTTLDYYTLHRTGIATTDTAKQVATGQSPWFIFNTANRSSGIALDANLVVTEQDQMIVTWQHMLKANIVAAPATAANTIGQPLADVPTNQFSLWNRYTFSEDWLKGTTVAVGGRYSSSAAISSAVNTTVRNPAFTIYNAMLARSFPVFERNIRVQLNVTNVTNKVYRDGPEGMFGPPRKFMVSLSTRL